MNPAGIPFAIQPAPAATRDETVRVVATRPSQQVRLHWAEYGMEATLLGLFMVSACAFTTLLNHPSSPAAQAIPQAALRRALMGIAMGSTAVALVHSPFGKRSGAHFNPAVTLTFFRLGKIERADALFYVVSQFIGGAFGVMLVALVLRGALSHKAVHYAVTQGSHGALMAFIAETVIAFVLMSVILFSSNSSRLMHRTPLFVACLVALYITFEAPYSGMSMNSARSTASALAARYFVGLWIYFTAPLLGMLSAAEVYLWLRHAAPICAKLHHANNQPCIFRCGYKQAAVGTKAAFCS